MFYVVHVVTNNHSSNLKHSMLDFHHNATNLSPISCSEASFPKMGITLATTRSPLVPLSNLCTIPGRTESIHILELISSPEFWSAGKLSNSASKLSSDSGNMSLLGIAAVGSPQWWRIAFTSVPLALPGAGWTTWNHPSKKWPRTKTINHQMHFCQQ